jgi:non-ribosomal peptide synthetase component E (peptide arylation enzyme)
VNSFKVCFNHSAQTLEPCSNLWFRTGDLARVDEAGNVYFLGSIKDVVRRIDGSVGAFEVVEADLWERSVMNMAQFQVPGVIQFVRNIMKTLIEKIDQSTLSNEGCERCEMRAVSRLFKCVGAN